jgi:hypothetical protein
MRGAVDAVRERAACLRDAVPRVCDRLEDRRVRGGDNARRARCVADPGAQDIGVDRQVLGGVLDGRGLFGPVAVFRAAAEVAVELARGENAAFSSPSILARHDLPAMVDVGDDACTVGEHDLAALAPHHLLGDGDNRHR